MTAERDATTVTTKVLDQGDAWIFHFESQGLDGGELPLSLLFRGKPMANVLVVAMSKDDPEKAVRARTDAKGHVTLKLAHAGFWLIKAVNMEAAPAAAS